MAVDPKREFLRHAVATLAYRAAKVVRDTPPGFGEMRAGKTRSAVAIVAHMGDLMEWALRVAKGPAEWRAATPGAWEIEVERFFAGLRALDDYLASDAPLTPAPEKLLQGPIADALTHVGQLATLRRLAGSPVRGESYFNADIVVGRVGQEQEQAPAPSEFD
jgi:hypothetical protein